MCTAETPSLTQGEQMENKNVNFCDFDRAWQYAASLARTRADAETAISIACSRLERDLRRGRCVTTANALSHVFHASRLVRLLPMS